MNNKKFVIKISKNGRSALSDSLDDYDFHTDKMVAKVYTRGVQKHQDIISYRFTTEPSVGITNIIKIPHGYAYTPAVMATISDPNISSANDKAFFKVPLISSLDFVTGSVNMYEIYADDTYLYVDINRIGTVWPTLKGKTVHIKYRITDMVGMA